MPFKPGQSGNPGGRPKVEKSVREWAQYHAQRAIARLGELIESDDERVAISACNAVLDRAYGRPQSESIEPQPTEINVILPEWAREKEDIPPS